MGKYFLLIFMILSAALSCSDTPNLIPKIAPNEISGVLNSIPAAAGYDNKTKDNAGWNLIFDENFDKDLSQWNTLYGGAYNNELQLYKPENLFLTEGLLYLYAKKEAVTGPTLPTNPELKDFDYTSARIESKKTFGPEKNKPIRIMARIQLPLGYGIWPAFWTVNNPYPNSGEIDILEYRGNEPRKFQSVYHFGNDKGLLTNDEINNFYYELKPGEPDFSTDFYVYELIWDQSFLTIKLNGKALHSFFEPNNKYVNSLFDKKHKLVLNMAVGGGFFRPLDKAKIVPNAAMVVDWVKVFSK
jgi:beta-glucanase (GH16 family)